MRIALVRGVFAISSFVVLLTPLAMRADDPVVFYACINGGNGGMRLVTADTPCHRSETRVQWNQTGPAGPAGPPGVNGVDGQDGQDGVDGVDGADAGGPPFIWMCTPLNYGNVTNSNALLHVFNASASTANVAVNFLNKDGVNLAGANVPTASSGDPVHTYPGNTGAATSAVSASNTLVMPFVTPFGPSSTGGNIAATIRIVSDQQIGVGANIFSSGFNVIPCSLVHK